VDRPHSPGGSEPDSQLRRKDPKTPSHRSEEVIDHYSQTKCLLVNYHQSPLGPF
jgi:hypothetical protein